MKLNMLIAVGAPEEEPSCGKPHINLAKQRPGTKHPGDPRPKLSATRALSDEVQHSYIVNSSADQHVPRKPFDTANPDVSGFTSRLCRSPPRRTSAGEESLKSAMQELRCGSKR
jgi:hypothetical protein